MQVRLLAAWLAFGALSSGCTWIGWGTYPQAVSTPGVERYGAYLEQRHLEPYKKKVHPYPLHEPIADADLTSVVTAPDLTLLVELEGYSESVYLWGIVLPVFPAPGHAHGDAPLRVVVHVAHAADGAQLQAHTLRLRTSEREFYASAVHLYRAKGEPEVNPSQAIAVSAHDRLDYDFELPVPREPFSLVIDGVPPVDFEPETVWHGGLVNMN